MKEHSDAETLIMKAVWDAGGDIAVQELIGKLETEYGRKYQRSTVVTFIRRMVEKGFVRTYKIGKLSYAHAQIKEETYRDYILNRDLKLWCGGQPSDLISALVKSRSLSHEESVKIRSLLDELDC